jgi:hypothetical protein
MGSIMYTPDGYMSALLMRAHQVILPRQAGFQATPKEYKRVASNYFAYAGPFEVDEERKTITHLVLVSLFPNWIGQKQQRIARIEGDALHLSTASPIQSGGRPVNAYLEWRRAHTL